MSLIVNSILIQQGCVQMVFFETDKLIDLIDRQINSKDKIKKGNHKLVKC